MANTKKYPRTVADHLGAARSFWEAREDAIVKRRLDPTNKDYLSDEVISEILAEEHFAEAAILALQYLLS